MASVREANLIAALQSDCLVCKAEGAREHVHHIDFVLESHHEVQTTWVECHSQALLGERVRHLVGFCRIIPNADSLVPRARRDQLFSNTDIETSDLSSVEGSENIVELQVIDVRLLNVLEDDVCGDELSSRSDRINAVFIFVGDD